MSKSTNVVTKKSQSVYGSRSIGGAAVLLMLFFVMSRLAGLAREVIIGAQFGASADLDAYLAAFRVPDLLFQLVAGGALGSAFIPTFSEYWVKGAHREAWLLLSRLLNLVTLLLIVLAGVAALMALPLVQRVIAPGFAPDQQLLTANLMRWMLLGTVVFGASGLIMGALNAVQHFLLPAAAPIFYNIAIILGALFLAPLLGVYGLAIGAAGGAFGHLLIQVPALWKHKFRYSFDWSFSDPGVVHVGKLMGPRALGLFAVQMQFLVNTILASRLEAGSISALNYAMLIMLLPQGVFAQAIATAAFPTFAAQVATGARALMGDTFGRMLRLVLFLTVPAAVVLFVLRVPLVQIMLERGAFSQESTALVAFALKFYALGLVAHSVLEVTVRAFYALHDTWTPVMVGVGAMLLNILLSIWWVNWLSYGGLALANSVATSLEALLLFFILGQRIHGLHSWSLLRSALRTVFAAILMGGVLWLWLRFRPLPLSVSVVAEDKWWVTAGGLVLANSAYLLASLLVNSAQLRGAAQVLGTRRR